jgi:hypothetical protein
MGMSAEWFRTGPGRARRRIDEARARTGGFVEDIGVLSDALGEFVGIGDRPDEHHARQLAEVLGCLTPDEYRHLVRQALERLQQASMQAARRAEHRLQQGIAEHSAEAQIVDQQKVTLAEIRGQDEWYAGFISVALILQALTWAIALPREYSRIIA